MVLVAAVGLLGTGSAAASHGSAVRLNDEQPDAIGDSGTGPDISVVDVEFADSGAIVWRIKFANRDLLFGPDFFQIFIDGNLQDGDGPDGFERAIQESSRSTAAYTSGTARATSANPQPASRRSSRARCRSRATPAARSPSIERPRGKAMTVTIVLKKEGVTLRKVFTTRVR